MSQNEEKYLMWPAAAGSWDSLVANFVASRIVSGKVLQLPFFPFPKRKEMSDHAACTYKGSWSNCWNEEVRDPVNSSGGIATREATEEQPWSLLHGQRQVNSLVEECSATDFSWAMQLWL